MKLSGCAAVRVERHFNHKFAEGSTVYIKARARKGVLESVWIKEVMVRYVNGNYMAPVFLYKERENGYFNEDELCSQYDAVLLAEAHYTARAAELLALLQKPCE